MEAQTKRKTMIQEVMTEPKKVEWREIPIPEIRDDQVLIQMKRIGICGSDIHVYHGRHPYVTYPLTQGHEVSGQIIQVGSAVSYLKIGQKVVIEPQIYCGKCYPCTHGKYNLCENLKVIGFQAVGAASEYFAIEASKVTPLPDAITYDEGAMIEPLAVAVHACRQAGNVNGIKAAVLGAGPIGNLLIQTLKAFGAQTVLVSDISDYRLSLAQSCGADAVCNSDHETFAGSLYKNLGPDGADIIFDCAGNGKALSQAIQCARKGSTIILVAVYSESTTLDLARLNDSELDLNTSMMYRHQDFVDAIQIVQEKKIQLKPLMTRHFPFREFQEAYEYIDQNREQTMKVIVDMVEGEE